MLICMMWTNVQRLSFFRVVNEMALCERITEELKTEHQLLWVQRMNNIRSRAEEIVNNQVIFV